MADARKIIKKIGGSKRGSTRRSSSTRRRSSSTRRDNRVMPRWKYITIATLITIGTLTLAYPIIRQTLNRFTSCSGENIFGICVPEGYSVYGVDISHHQGNINWGKLKSGEQSGPAISFAYIKATEGCSHTDTQFTNNWKAAKKHGFMRGAYHYFSTQTQGEKQARKFISLVKLEPGDLPPMIDVEEKPKDTVKYRKELKKFIETIEKHYGVKPIIYTNKKFHDRYIENHFDDYPLWIARYDVSDPGINKEWIIWQFSEDGRLPGIKEKVDINVFNGTLEELEKLRIK